MRHNEDVCTVGDKGIRKEGWITDLGVNFQMAFRESEVPLNLHQSCFY